MLRMIDELCVKVRGYVGALLGLARMDFHCFLLANMLSVNL
jgi:membrane protein DedA with SNARE-associated domain